MTYTFLHRGVLMGESDLPSKSKRRGQRIGAFHPTAYGRTLLPRVTCVLQASFALKSQLKSLRQAAKDAGPEEFERLLHESEAGRTMIDVGRVLSEVELRDPNGRRLEFASIAFSDLNEIRRLGETLGTNSKEELKDLPPNRPEFIVSVTLNRGQFPVARPAQMARGASERRHEN